MISFDVMLHNTSNVSKRLNALVMQCGLGLMLYEGCPLDIYTYCEVLHLWVIFLLSNILCHPMFCRNQWKWSFQLQFWCMFLQNLSQGRGSNRRLTTPDAESLSNLEARNIRRPSSSSVAGGIPPLGRFLLIMVFFSLYFFLVIHHF